MTSCELIQPDHLQRPAIVYIRQSTPQQATSNRESLQLQYALRHRAIDCGWPAEAVETIDADVGLSGATAEGRPGFKELVNRVSLGQAGIVFAYDVTRLARNCSDWYQLLDLCGYRHCLIGDHDGIYDPSSINGRLLLGLKGQISELEMHTIRSRLTAGLLSKARRGELRLRLPVGLTRDPTGRVVKDPDQEVQRRIDLIFRTFLRVRAVGAVVRYFNERKLLIPRLDYWGEVIWRKPSVSAIASTLKNPAYAGAYVYGRSVFIPQDRVPQKKRKKPLPIESWKICIPDLYPAYISWPTFVKIGDMIRNNHSEYRRNQTRGVPRAGKALLHGIVYCGICGHQMTVQYRSGTQYICNHLQQNYRRKVCQRVPADPVDQHVVEAFWKALAPAELDLFSRTLSAICKEQEDLRQARRQQLERLRYQARLAERQYNHADPENRLVAAELERRWEDALRELKQAEEAFDRDMTQPDQTPTITDKMRADWERAGQKLPELWAQDRLKPQQKKALLRSLIDKVVLDRRSSDTVQTRIVWKGGESSMLEVPVTVGNLKNLSFGEEMEKRIVQWARQGKSDEWIMSELARQGYRSALRSYVPLSTVQSIRLRHHILVKGRPQSRRIPGHLTIGQVASRLRISRHRIYQWIQAGTIEISLNEQWELYLFPDTRQTMTLLRRLRDGQISSLRF